jgi:hypothetical protein
MFVIDDGSLRRSVVDHVAIASTMRLAEFGGAINSLTRFWSTTA